MRSSRVFGSDCGLGGALAFDDLEGKRVGALNEVEGESGHGRGGAVFDGEGDAVIRVATQIEVGIAPGVELGGTAERLAGAHGRRPSWRDGRG